LKQRGVATDYYEQGELLERETYGTVQRIVWPNIPSERRTGHSGQALITARELAALVSARAGVKLQRMDVSGKTSHEIAHMESAIYRDRWKAHA
ncbi:MAG TPA: hypothetical protein VKQ36_15095, partial [Ktedonobacterales bacterium]|nr:hypothetical protein [Ktedonobacterales bacterium]